MNGPSGIRVSVKKKDKNRSDFAFTGVGESWIYYLKKVSHPLLHFVDEPKH